MSNSATSKITVRCDSLTKEYTKQQCDKLAGIGYGELYNILRSGGQLLSDEDRQVINLANKLKELVETFTPNVPVSASERKQIDARNKAWQEYLDKLPSTITAKATPIYLADEVNRILKEKGSTITCERKHLVWYLHRYGAEQMHPQNIADALMDIAPEDFDKLRMPTPKVAYSITPSADGIHDRSTILPVIEFIYSIPSSISDKSLVTKIKNDLKLMEEFKKLKNGANNKYDPRPYYNLREKMQTIPSESTMGHNNQAQSNVNDLAIPGPSGSSSSEATDTTVASTDEHQHEQSAYDIAYAKFIRKELMTENDQLSFLQKGKCPICGKDIETRNGSKGEYLNCSNHYFAGINNGYPYVNRDNKNGVIPKPAETA